MRWSLPQSLAENIPPVELVVFLPAALITLAAALCCAQLEAIFSFAPPKPANRPVAAAATRGG